MTMRLSLGHIDEYDNRVATFARQLGLRGVQFHTPNLLPGEAGLLEPGRTPGAAGPLRRRRAARSTAWRTSRSRTSGRSSADCPAATSRSRTTSTTIRNIAAVGIDLLGYNFLPTFVWRTSMVGTGRGGAKVTVLRPRRRRRTATPSTGYRLTPAEPLTEPITADQMWANHQYFLDAVLPVAEEVGVRLALHPDDPPVDEPLGGAARIFTSPAALRRRPRAGGQEPGLGAELLPRHGVGDGRRESVNEVIDTLGAAGAIFYVHFRDVQGTVPRFTRVLPRRGQLQPRPGARADCTTSASTASSSTTTCPAMIGDPDTWMDTIPEAYCSRGRAHAIGYLQGVLNGLGLD